MRRISVIFFIIIFLFFSCKGFQRNDFTEEINELFEKMSHSYQHNDMNTYFHYFLKLTDIKDSVQVRKALLYYFFDYPYRLEKLLFKIQGIKRYGFYEEWEVLDRFYGRYREKYSREAVGKDSSLMSEHQAYIQFLAVCNYEKIKPLYLQELSETIRDGDYTYAFNSYLLPEHWEEAADTLMKYYWDVEDEDTRIKINKAIVKITGTKAFAYYKKICEHEPEPKVIDMLFFEILDDKFKINGKTMWKILAPSINDSNLRRIYMQTHD